jgi:hypothetical protein
MRRARPRLPVDRVLITMNLAVIVSPTVILAKARGVDTDRGLRPGGFIGKV